VAAEQLVAEAEELLATRLSRKSVAIGSLGLGCGEPNLCIQPKTRLRLCLDYEKKIPITFNLRYMHEILNADKIKN
jgi:hypothetical protein